MTAHTRTDNAPSAPTPGALSAPNGTSTSTALLAQLDALRFAAGEADVLAVVTLEWFDSRGWTDADPAEVERLAYLLGLIAKASTTVVTAVARLHGALADAQPAEDGDHWDGDDLVR